MNACELFPAGVRMLVADFLMPLKADVTTRRRLVLDDIESIRGLPFAGLTVRDIVEFANISPPVLRRQ